MDIYAMDVTCTIYNNKICSEYTDLNDKISDTSRLYEIFVNNAYVQEDEQARAFPCGTLVVLFSMVTWKRTEKQK